MFNVHMIPDRHACTPASLLYFAACTVRARMACTTFARRFRGLYTGIGFSASWIMSWQWVDVILIPPECRPNFALAVTAAQQIIPI